ncbi:hypothetical protein HUW63_24445 [Myxococcus sp. AM001]|nr:hypothetical protein [Myxococcus sp. AM001]
MPVYDRLKGRDVLLKRNVVTVIGEHAVFVELLKRGFDAYMSHGPNQPGWDIVVIGARRRVLVQVKATQRDVVQINLNQDFDFLVLVLFDGQESEVGAVPSLSFYVFSKREVGKLVSPESEVRGDSSRSISISETGKALNASERQRAVNQWGKIEKFGAARVLYGSCSRGLAQRFRLAKQPLNMNPP